MVSEDDEAACGSEARGFLTVCTCVSVPILLGPCEIFSAAGFRDGCTTILSQLGALLRGSLIIGNILEWVGHRDLADCELNAFDTCQNQPAEIT